MRGMAWVGALLVLGGCGTGAGAPVVTIPGGNPERGRELVEV